MSLLKIKFTVFLKNFILYVLSLPSISVQCSLHHGDRSVAKQFLFSLCEVHHTLRSGGKNKRLLGLSLTLLKIKTFQRKTEGGGSQHVSVTLLSSFLTLSCLILTMTLCIINYYLCFANLKTEAQKYFII